MAKFERVPKFQGGTTVICGKITKTKSGATLKNCEIIFKDKAKRKIVFSTDIHITER